MDFCGVAGTPAAGRGWGCVRKDEHIWTPHDEHFLTKV